MLYALRCQASADLAVQINPNSEELRSEEAHCPGISGGAW
jgi:hypothetical protein